MIAWIEIPVIDLERATAFYADVFRLTFEREDIGEPKRSVDVTSGYWARFSDTEGNLIGLLSPH
jgi:predicted enzyme related to lactoylglutathione lyase